MIVVTSGKKYIDIDAYASCVAYRDLLRFLGFGAVAVTSAVINESVTLSLQGLAVGFDDYIPVDGDEFVVLDLSNPEFLDGLVEEKRMVEIIDHHPGFEKYWEGRVRKVQIEPVGAVATVIFERYREAGKLGEMGPEVAKLLMAAILDNTLNFGAKITTERGRTAHMELMKVAGEDEGFTERYFLECQNEIEKDLTTAIRNDTKVVKAEFEALEVMGQLLCWDGKKFLGREGEIRDVLDGMGRSWAMNLISLKDGRSYILVSDDEVVGEIRRLFGGVREGNVVILDRAWLRKELIKKALEDSRGGDSVLEGGRDGASWM